jgi:hypothetical protein
MSITGGSVEKLALSAPLFLHRLAYLFSAFAVAALRQLGFPDPV